MKSAKNHQEVIASIRQEVPERPGVYLFFDEHGNVMYIGKSVNLKRRMLSYFREDLSGVENRIKEMIFNIRDFEFQETETEFLALLLEDKLIKENLPSYNIRQQEFPEYRYLLLTDDRYPTCKMVDHSEDFGNQKVFGPFKDQYFVNDILEMIQRFLNLRACQEPEPIRKSLNFEFGYCAGPCRQKISPEAYSQIVGQVIEFLNGNESAAVEKLTKAMEAAAAALEFEKASELKNKIEFCKNFCSRQRFIHRFKKQNLIIFENGDDNLSYKFIKGRLATPVDFVSTATIPQPVFQCQDSDSCEDARFLLDRANIVYKWINSKHNRCEYYFSKH